jgi:ABC-type ATPase involved in cell division/GNAT superfamily N-acetyltransferase
MTILKSKVERDAITDQVSLASDFAWTGENTFTVPEFDMPKDFSIGVITGPSGTGKSSILKQIGRSETKVEWDPNKAVCSHFNSFEEASEKLGAVALNSIPDILKPYHTLSTGQKARADVARVLESGATIDEFTSTVDRNVGLAMANSIRKYVDRKGLKNILLVSCHRDFIEYLNPDFVYDTKTSDLQVGRLARKRPAIDLSIVKANKESWEVFKSHHYLTGSIPNNTPHAYLYYWGKELIGFGSLNAFPHPKLKACMNIGRVVVFPDFQGLGFGYKIIENLAQIATHNYSYTTNHYGRCKIVTAIPALQAKLMSSPDWQFIKGSDVRKEHKDTGRKFGGYDASYYEKHLHRTTKAFHYIGHKGFKDISNLVEDKLSDAKGNIFLDNPPIANKENNYQKEV